MCVCVFIIKHIHFGAYSATKYIVSDDSICEQFVNDLKKVIFLIRCRFAILTFAWRT